MMKIRNIYTTTILLITISITSQSLCINKKNEIQGTQKTKMSLNKKRSIILEMKKHPFLFMAGAYIAWCTIVIGGLVIGGAYCCLRQ